MFFKYILKSTVKNADQIIVLKNGQIVERGTHVQFSSQQSRLF
jgi:ABC-type transport system involved in Fe-S cluster assembly fused permease/ATPase subunit